MTPIELLWQWVQGEASAADYEPARGEWIDSDELIERRIIVMVASGGRSPAVGIRYPHADVWVLGKRGERNVAGAVADLERFADALMERTLTVFAPEGATFLRALADVIGPGYTTEGRPWYKLSFEITI